MIKFLQRIGQGSKEFGRDFAKSFKEGYHSPMPEGGHGGVAGFLGTIIVGVPVSLVIYGVKEFLSKDHPSPKEIRGIAKDAMDETGSRELLRKSLHASPEERMKLKNDWEQRIAERKAAEETQPTR